MNGFERIREAYNPLSLWYSNEKCLQIFPFKNFLQIWDLDILNTICFKQHHMIHCLFDLNKLCITSCTNILHREQLGKLHCISKSGIILAQNDDGPIKWANGPYPIQIHANLEIFMGPLQNLMGPRILKIPIRAQLTWDLNNLYMGPSQKYKSIFAKQ